MKKPKKPRIAKPNRHSPLRKVKWWLRARWRWFKQLKRWQQALIIACPILLIVLVIPLITFAYFALTMGDMESLMNRNNTGVVLRDVHGETFFSTGTAEHRELVPLENISIHMQRAVIASEDRNFYEHRGFSLLSTLRAVYGYALSGGGEFGGSTLTQQLAKMTVLSSDRSFIRQYQAFSVAVAIEQRYSKDEILSMYLNSAYFGNNAFGVERAAELYFDKEPSELTLAESAMLVGLLPAPSAYSPITGSEERANERQGEVLTRMVREDMITDEEREQALSEQLTYQPPAVIRNDAPHFTEMVLEELYERYSEEEVQRSGYQVTTSLDLTMQRQALENVRQRVPYIQNMGGSNAGLIAIDPRSGQIRALVGSVDYANEEWGALNIVNAKRQPGSSFKPIYYAAALGDGTIQPAQLIRDEPIDINGYRPQNATRQFYGNVTVRQALARSLNIPAIKVMQQYGLESSIEAAKQLGITTLDDAQSHGLSLAVGSAEVPLREITNAYAAFANGGQQHETTTLHEIQDKFSKVLYRQNSQPKEAINPQGAFLISSILSDNGARAMMFGNALTVPGKNVAVKTGTTDDNRDAWAVGYTTDIAVGVWVGNNDNSAMVSGGADMAGPIWRQSMTQFVGTSSPRFSAPSRVVQRAVCYGTGGLASQPGTNTYEEYFLDSALPTVSCEGVVEREEEQRPPEEEPEIVEEEEEPEEGGDDGEDDPGNGGPELPDPLPPVQP